MDNNINLKSKMAKKPTTVYQNEISPTDVLTSRPEIPADYHTEDFTENFLGEIFDVSTGKYYSEQAR